MASNNPSYQYYQFDQVSDRQASASMQGSDRWIRSDRARPCSHNIDPNLPSTSNYGRTFDPSGWTAATYVTSSPATQSFHPAPYTGNLNIEIEGTSGSLTMSQAAQADLHTEPMARWAREEGGLTFLTNQASSVERWMTPGAPVVRSGTQYQGFRQGPLSNNGSYATYPNDSGYGTAIRPAPSVQESHHSKGASHHGDENQSIAEGLQAVRFRDNPDSNAYAAATRSDGAASTSGWPPSPGTTQQRRCRVSDCMNPRYMNPSEYRKHMQKHEKPFKCKVVGCSRSSEGFTSRNDLDRHTKSVHKQLPASANDRSFICQGTGCTRKRKIWPRLDNFKSHCKRMHAAEDVDALIQRSEQEAANQGYMTSLTAPTLEVSRAQPPSSQLGLPRATTQFAEDMTNGGAEALLHLSQGGLPSPRQPPHRHIQLQRTSPAPLTDIRRSTESTSFNARKPNARAPPPPPPPPPRPTVAPEEVMLQVDSADEDEDLDYAEEVEGPSRVLEEHTRESESGSTNIVQPIDRPPTPPSSHHQPTSAETSQLDQLKEILANDFAASQARGEASPSTLASIAMQRLAGFLASISTSTAFPPPHPKRTASEAGLDDQPSASLTVTGSSAPKERKVQCQSCNKVMSRMCDLKKHEKRHSRPWGCTNESCNKVFGSKNDWKRHENSQHYQLETWRCHEASESSRIRQCARIFFRADPFRAHLRKDHDVKNEEYVREELKARRIGRNWQERFWCGFCQEIVRLKKKGLQAWDERFNHIDDLHFKKGQVIETWYPLDKDIPKGMLRSEKRRAARDKKRLNNNRGGSSGGAGGSSRVSGSGAGAGSGASALYGHGDADSDSDSTDLDDPLRDDLEEQHPTPPRAPDAPPIAAGASALPPPRARRPGSPGGGSSGSSGNDSPPSDVDIEVGGALVSLQQFMDYYRRTGKRLAYQWFCCRCSNGSPNNPATHLVCLNCNHQPCGSCNAQPVERGSARD